jgi:serine/threonine protein kinase
LKHWIQNNVLVNDEGCAVLTDFGRAKVMGDPVFSTPLVAGLAKYMAPELLPASGEVNVDELFSKKSDIYAFAMFCFEASES